MTDAQRRVVAFVQAHPRLLAALYDLDLTPDETVFNALWPRTVRIAALYAEAAGLEPPWLVAEATAPTSADPQHASMSIAEIESRQRVSDGLIRDHDAGEHDMMGEDRREAGRRLLARARMFASMTDEDSPEPPERFGNGFEARAWESAVPRDVRHPPRPDDHSHGADAYLGAGAVFVAPDGPAGERAGEPMRRMACGCVPRFELVEACAAEAERFEREALGSPIAQDTARQIRLAILALR